MQKHCFMFVLFILLIHSMASAGNTAALYTIDECIALALKNNPAVAASLQTVKAGESRVGQAKADYYPSLALTAGYQKVGPVSPAGISPDAYDQYSTGVNLDITLFDFGKTSRRVQIQNLNVEAARADHRDIIAQIIFNVKIAYYNLIQCERNLAVAMDTMNQFQQHLEQANAFFNVGIKPKFDVTKAEVDYGNARLSVLRAENALLLAKLTLKDVMGIPKDDEFDVADTLGFEKDERQLNDALDAAYSKRPDLISVMARKEAAGHSVELAQKGYFPVVSGSAGYAFSGTGFPMGSGWNAGASLNVPLFSGFSTKHEVNEAIANLEIVKANEISVRQKILLDVQQAYLNVRNAADQISMAEMTVLQAKENYDLASGRYKAGVGNPIEIADATITLNNARANLNAALYDYKIAQAALDKAIGENP